MLKLRRLRIEKFRSVAKNAELSFSDGINVLLGQNGTGKTTLLELISMVVRSDFSSLAKEEFAIEYELSEEEGEDIIVVMRNDRAAPDLLPRQVKHGAREGYRPSAEVRGATDRRLLLRYDVEHGLTLEHGAVVSHATIPSPVEPRFLAFVSAATSHFMIRLLNSDFVYRFDESLDLFRRIIGNGDTGWNMVIFDGRRWEPDIAASYLVPEALLSKIKLSYQPNKSDYSFTHEELSFLVGLKDMMGFSASELRVDVVEQRDHSAQLGNVVLRFWWEDGTFITHDRLSYGQKRLLMFYYYLACNPDIVIADELVNGLHHRWITASIEAIGQRQAFLTSQNPLLLDYIPITSVEAVQRSFVLCRGEPREGRPGWIWENMSEDDARELFSAYEVGVEHVSEILQSRGLW